jgi:protein disulfide-isomerase A1
MGKRLHRQERSFCCFRVYSFAHRALLLSFSSIISLLQYIRKQTEPAYITVNTDDELTAFRGKDGAEVLGVFSSLDSAEAKAFLAAAEELRQDFGFAISTNGAFASGTVPAVLLFKADGSDAVTTADAEVLASSDATRDWIKAESFELVGEIGPENFQVRWNDGLAMQQS